MNYSTEHPSHHDKTVSSPPNVTAIRTRHDGHVADVLAEVVPLALAIAASPFTIIPAILLLLTPRAAAAGGLFLVGWLLGLAATVTAFTLLAAVVEVNEGTPTWAAWGRVAIGVTLVVLGIRRWVQRRIPAPPPAWMSSLADVTPGKAFGFALLLAVANPKVLLLTAAAGLSIGAAELTAGQTATAIGIFTVVAALGVLIPVVLYLILGERMLAPLSRSRDWLERNNAAVMAVVFVLIGAGLTAKGFAGIG